METGIDHAGLLREGGPDSNMPGILRRKISKDIDKRRGCHMAADTG